MSPGLEKKNSKKSRSLSLSINQVQPFSYLQKPLLWLLLSYLTGILLQNSYEFFDFHYLFVFCLFISLLAFFSYKRSWKITPILLFIFFVFIGMFNTSYHLHPHGLNHIYYFSDKEGFLSATVYQAEFKEDKMCQELQINTHVFQYEGKSYQVKGNVLLKVYGSSPILKYGDSIKARILLKKPNLPGNFGEFNYREYLLRKNIFLIGSTQAEELKITGHSNQFGCLDIIHMIREKITQKIDQIFPAPEAGFIKAMIIGDRAKMDPKWIQIFQNAGILHILAISGLHVGIIALFLLFILKWIPANDPKYILKYLIIILILFGYAAMAGFRPSVIRAVVMFAIMLTAKYLHRPYHLYNSLYLAALLLLLWQPLYLFDAGFLLSFVVTFFIIFLAPILTNKLSFLPSGLANLFSVSLSAWLGMAPLSAYFFYQVSFIAIFSNILIVPLVGVILILALLGIGLGFLSLPLAGLMVSLNHIFIPFLFSISQKLSSLPLAYQYIAQPEIHVVIFYYFFILTFFYTVHFWLDYDPGEKKKKFWMIVIMFSAIFFFPVFSPSGLLYIHFINVGQGDCILIQTPQRKNILIDGGGTPFSDFDIGVNTVIPYLRREGIKSIDVIFLTHPDLDHIEGLIPVLQQMNVGLVIDGGSKCHNEIYQTFISIIKEKKNIQYYQTRRGDILQISPHLEIFILHPPQIPAFDLEKDFNNQSIVLKLRYKKTNFLFTGDIEEDTEQDLLSWGNVLESNILKVAHHGSATSTSEIFLEKVKPEIAVISVGPNSFGHPNAGVTKRLNQLCYKVFRTDTHGTIIIKSDGNKNHIKTLR